MSTRLFHPTAGFIVLTISLITYCLCLEPSVSWWDCGEFISSAYRLEVGHPPGAPLFMLLGRIFTLFAAEPGKVALMVNLLSAIASAFTVLFLYLTIVMLAEKLTSGQRNPGDEVPVSAIFAGIIGSLVYAFSDTFWFSAVEGEVYELSSLFTAAVFWAILRWEMVADEPGSSRWILLIAFLMGLSIGVHLLNLLAIPAIVLLWYWRKNPQPSWKGSLLALSASLGILALIMYVLIPGVAILASWFELFFVNLFRLPYNSGLIVFVVLLVLILGWGIRETQLRNSVAWNTALLALAFMLTGYSSYTSILIRSKANPPMNQGKPDNVINLISYLNREQYGDRPLLTGPSYNAPVIRQKPGRAIYDRVDGRYKIVDRIYKPLYDKRFVTIFPRLWSKEPNHVQLYKEWARIKGKPIEVKDDQGKIRVEYCPTFSENLTFFFSYQLVHMYFRYFLWNFSGRQNDTESQGGIRNGNWISGIGFIDEARLGPQGSLPERDRNNKSRNRYYLLPLLLGFAGAFYQYKRSSKDFWVVLLLFLFTGIAIVLYLNQYPNQPRERDYSYAGSFYAFAIWVGLGISAIWGLCFTGVHNRRFGTTKRSADTVRKGLQVIGAMAAVLALSTPIIMAVQNWDDHNRSNRFIARDFAYNYLNSCAPNAILFTSGDNDTFPLWYAQEVEGVRPDVRVICLPYLAQDWYIDQLKRKAWLSDPVPFSLTPKQYGKGLRNYTPVIEQIKDTVDLFRLINFATSENESDRIPLEGGGSVNYIPTRQFRIGVDREKVLANGTVPAEDAHLIVPEISWKLNRTSLYKNDLMILDLIAHNNWNRPIYFTYIGDENSLGLEHYFRPEGFTYRLVPIRQVDESVQSGSINTSILYERLMKTFRWGNISDPSVFIDSNTYRTTLILQLRRRFTDLAAALVAEGKTDQARLVADRITGLLPVANFRNDVSIPGLAEIYYQVGVPDKGNSLLRGYLTEMEQDLRYIISVEKEIGSVLSNEAEQNITLLGEISRLAEAYNQMGLVEEVQKLIEKLQINPL